MATFRRKVVFNFEYFSMFLDTDFCLHNIPDKNAALGSNKGEAKAQSTGEKPVNHTTEKDAPTNGKPEHAGQKDDSEGKETPGGGQKNSREQAKDAAAEEDEEVLTMEGGEEAD